jgi:hypothetical protein
MILLQHMNINLEYICNDDQCLYLLTPYNYQFL